MKLSNIFRMIVCIAFAAISSPTLADTSPVRQVVSPSVTVTFPSRPERAKDELFYLAHSVSGGHPVGYIAMVSQGRLPAWLSWAFSHYPDLMVEQFADKLKQNIPNDSCAADCTVDATIVPFAGTREIRFTVDGLQASPSKSGKKHGILQLPDDTFSPGQPIHMDGYFLLVKEGVAVLAVSTPGNTPADPALLDTFANSAKLDLLPVSTDTAQQQFESVQHWVVGIFLAALLLIVLVITGVTLGIIRLVKRRRRQPPAV